MFEELKPRDPTEGAKEDPYNEYYREITNRFKTLIDQKKVEIKFHHRRTHLIRREGNLLVIASCVFD